MWNAGHWCSSSGCSSPCCGEAALFYHGVPCASLVSFAAVSHRVLRAVVSMSLLPPQTPAATTAPATLPPSVATPDPAAAAPAVAVVSNEPLLIVSPMSAVSHLCLHHRRCLCVSPAVPRQAVAHSRRWRSDSRDGEWCNGVVVVAMFLVTR
jgi:hypothetical protein